MNGLKTCLIILGLSLLMSGCGSPHVKITEKYSLERFDDGHSYFVDDSDHRRYDEGGVFGGDIKQLGINNRWMLAYVGKNSYKTGGDRYGLYALNLEDNKVFGPFNEEDINKHPEWQGIKLRNPATFFERKDD